jgi:hypothetical protein
VVASAPNTTSKSRTRRVHHRQQLSSRCDQAIRRGRRSPNITSHYSYHAHKQSPMGFLASSSPPDNVWSRIDEPPNRTASYFTQLEHQTLGMLRSVPYNNTVCRQPHPLSPPNHVKKDWSPSKHTTTSEEICVGALMLSNSTAHTSGTSHPTSEITTDDTAVVFGSVT